MSPEKQLVVIPLEALRHDRVSDWISASAVAVIESVTPTVDWYFTSLSPLNNTVEKCYFM